MRQAEVVLELPLDPGVGVIFGDELEVSLDCSHCVRTDRTVIFTLGATTAECCPGSAQRTDEVHPPFPGRIVTRVVRRGNGSATATYRLEYDVTRFDDAKYGPDQRPWSGYPTWARVSFVVTCPNCGSVEKASTQSNIVRPFSRSCDCGYVFFVERREMPVLRWLDPERQEWCEVGERWGEAAHEK